MSPTVSWVGMVGCNIPFLYSWFETWIETRSQTNPRRTQVDELKLKHWEGGGVLIRNRSETGLREKTDGWSVIEGIQYFYNRVN